MPHTDQWSSGCIEIHYSAASLPSLRLMLCTPLINIWKSLISVSYYKDHNVNNSPFYLMILNTYWDFKGFLHHFREDKQLQLRLSRTSRTCLQTVTFLLLFLQLKTVVPLKQTDWEPIWQIVNNSISSTPVWWTYFVVKSTCIFE